MPPSPWLSARMTNSRYLTVITMISDQNISESTPRMLASSTTRSCSPAERLAERVERAGADVAEDHTERADRQRS